MTARLQVLAANWKMYKTREEARAFIAEFLPLLQQNTAELVICPPATLLAEMRPLLANSRVKLGAQNIYWEAEGAYTGEISSAQAQDAGADYCLAGHSERRQYFGETDAHVAKKAQAAFSQGLIPIVCVGETLAEREAGQTLAVLQKQVEGSLLGLAADARLIVAYEPVWAIGTGKVATPADAEEACKAIRATLAKLFGPLAEQIRILYGGSVKPENIVELLACPNIDGALVGGAALKAPAFAAIANAGA